MVNVTGSSLRWEADQAILARDAARRGPAPVAIAAKVEPKPVRRQRFSEPSPSELAERYDLLEQAPVFYTLPDRVLRALARRMRTLAFRAGDVIVRQGEPTTAMFFVLRGHCQVRLESGQGHAVAVALLSRADFFGWSWLAEQPATATVVALDDCQLQVLDSTAAQTVLATEPAVLDQLETLAKQQDAGYAGIAAQVGWARAPTESLTVGVYSPKGGSGRTTLALNVAGALARRHPGDVLLLDVSFPFTQAALLANLTPVNSLAKLAGEPEHLTEELLLSAVLFHPASLMILPGCIKPEEADLVTPDLVARALEILTRTFPYVIVDLGVAIDEVTLAVLDHAQHVLLVTPPELTAVKAVRDAHNILTSILGFAAENVSVVLNSRSPNSPIKRESLERRMGSPIAIEIGHDGGRPDAAALEGQILALGERPSEIARASHRIAELLERRRAASSPPSGEGDAHS